MKRSHKAELRKTINKILSENLAPCSRRYRADVARSMTAVAVGVYDEAVSILIPRACARQMVKKLCSIKDVDQRREWLTAQRRNGILTDEVLDQMIQIEAYHDAMCT